VARWCSSSRLDELVEARWERGGRAINATTTPAVRGGRRFAGDQNKSCNRVALFWGFHVPMAKYNIKKNFTWNHIFRWKARSRCRGYVYKGGVSRRSQCTNFSCFTSFIKKATVQNSNIKDADPTLVKKYTISRCFLVHMPYSNTKKQKVAWNDHFRMTTWG
jgi:hypothetical protein